MSRIQNIRIGLLLGLGFILAGCSENPASTAPGPVDLTQSTLSVSRASGVAADGLDRSVIEVTLRDAKLNPIQGQAVTLTATGEGNTLVQPESTTNELGVATGSITSTVAGSKTVSAAVVTGALTEQKTVTFVPVVKPPSRLSFSVQPSVGVLGQPLAPAIQVTFLDADGGLAPVTDEVTVRLGDNPGSATLGGTLTTAAVAGVATFRDLTVSRPGAGYTLVATSSSLTQATSTPFDVTAGAVTALVLSGLPATSTAGVSVEVTVTAQDAQGNTATHYTGTVTLTSSDGQAELPAAVSFTAGDNGTHTFTGVTFKTAGPQTLTAGDTRLTALASTTVKPATAHELLVSGIPSPVNAGEPQSVSVTVVDAFGNTVSDYAGTLGFSSSDPRATLPAPFFFIGLEGGTHTFTGELTLKTPSSATTVTATDTSSPSVTGSQGPIVVNVGSPAQLAFVVQPTNAEAGSAITPAIQVAVLDVAGNSVSTATNPVAITLKNARGATLLGTTSRLAVGGVATFDGLQIDTPNTGYVLTASSGMLAAADSAAFDIAVPNQLPSVGLTSPTANQDFTAPASVTLTATASDADGTVSKVEFFQGATLVGSATTAPYSVVWSNVPVGSYSLTAKATDNQGATQVSSAVAITVSPAITALVLSGLSATSTAGVSQAVTVTARDAQGNTATHYTGTVTLTSSDGRAELPAAVSFTAGDNGTHTFTGVTFKTAGPQTLTAGDTRLTASASTTVKPATAHDVLVSGIPSPVNAGEPQSVSVTVVDLFGNTVSDYTGTLGFSSSDPRATLPALFTFSGTEGGTHTFSNQVTLKTPSSATTVTATDTSTPSVTGSQGPIVVNVGSPAQLAFVVQPTTAEAGSAISPPIQVAVVDAAGNTVSTASNTVVLTLKNARGATLSGTPSQTAVGGVATFNALQIDNANTGYVLTASSGTLAPADSSAFDIAAPNQLPSVSLTSPTANQNFTAPANVTLTATASDADGTVSKVEFFQGATLIGSATTAPYSVVWSNAPVGSYSLTAKATDNRGATQVSVAVAITVSPPPPTILYVHGDHLGTPRAVTNESNVVVWRNLPTNEPFGTALPEEDPDGDGTATTINLRFPGQYFDSETQLHYNNFRDYDPGSGRYVQSDPIGLAGGLNLYAYVDGHPVDAADPSGLILGADEFSKLTPQPFDSLERALIPNPDVYVLRGHGSPSTFGGHGPEYWAQRILQDKRYKPGMSVYVLACRVGDGSNSFVARLAKLLPRSTVLGPTNYYRSGSDAFNIGRYKEGGASPASPDDIFVEDGSFAGFRGPR